LVQNCINIWYFAWSENKAATQRTGSARITFPPSYSFAFPSLFCVYIFHCIYLLVASRRGTCIMDNSRVLNPSFPILCVPFCSPRSTRFQTGASRWQFPISITSLNYPVTVSLALNDKHEEISSNAESSKSYHERHIKIKVMAVDLSFFCYYFLLRRFSYFHNT